MTKKDFELIARVIRECRNESVGYDTDTLDDLAVEFTEEFARAYPKFKAGRFLDACGCPRE